MDNITNINLGACPLQYLSVGYVGETGARPVSFDFSAWASEYGAGVLQLLLQRPGDADPYPVLLDIDGTTATWTPDATATEKPGQGQAQFVYTVGGVIVKNAIFRVLIALSLGAAGDPPEPYEDWLERLLTIAAEAQQSAIDAAGSAEAAGTSADLAAEAKTAAETAQTSAEAAKTGAETAAATAGQSAALARAKAAEAAQASQTAVENADYSETQRIAAESAAVLAVESAERSETAEAGANQAKADAQSAAGAAAGSAAAAAAAVAGIESKGAQQIEAIETAGATQIAAVDAAGAARVQAIEDKGEEVLESIPADYSELSADVVDLKSSFDDISEETAVTVDKNALTKLNAYIKPAGSIATQSNTRVCYFKCLPDTEYVVSKMPSARFRAGYTTQIPANNVTVSGFVADNEATSLTIVTGSNALYAVVYYYDGANDILTEDEIFDSLEITYGQEITAIDRIARAKGLSDDIKDALLTCFRNVAWINDHGQDYYDALETALYPPDPHVGPVSISADYTQSHTVYDTDSLDGLKADLVVRATYSDGTVKAISDYVLSGALTVGTSVITVEYNGVTTTFEVTVTDFYNNWVWDSATDSAMKQIGSAATQYDRGESEGDYRYSPEITTNNARRCFVVDRGRANTNVCNSSGVLVTDRYLIPVPPTATKATFTISPSTQYCALRPWIYDTGNGKWKRGTDGGWKKGTGTITFDSGENKYISINCKPTSDGNTAYNGTTLPYPSVHIEFE